MNAYSWILRYVDIYVLAVELGEFPSNGYLGIEVILLYFYVYLLSATYKSDCICGLRDQIIRIRDSDGFTGSCEFVHMRLGADAWDHNPKVSQKLESQYDSPKTDGQQERIPSFDILHNIQVGRTLNLPLCMFASENATLNWLETAATSAGAPDDSFPKQNMSRSGLAAT